ncbi:MAG: hypothetical protein QG577_577 [Thermodesulfobacteriota bacterium]|nr:hypothetical protein [Thermodesulfobacteriota bacterium]
MKVDESRGVSSPEPSSSQSYNVHWLRYIVEAIYIRKGIFFVSLLIPPCLALIISFLMPKVYQASTKIWAQEQRSADPFRREQAQSSFLKDQQGLILSNVVATRVLETLPPEYSSGKTDASITDLPPAQRAGIIAKLQKNVEAKIDPREGGSNFIELKAKGRSSEEAAYLANLFARTYIDYYFELKSGIAHSSYRFLETQRDQVAGQLKESEDKLQDFEAKLGPKLIQLIELQKESSSSSFSGSFKFMETYELLAADWAERSRTDALYQDLRNEQKGMFVPLESSSKNLSQVHLQDKLVDLRAKLAEVKQRWTDTAPEVQMLQYEIQSAESLLFQNRNVETLAGREKLDFMQERTKQIEETMGEIAANRVTFENLRREVQNHAEIYKKVQQELESSRMAAEMSVYKTASIVVIDEAVPPLRPVSPNKVLNLAIGVLLGLGAGLWLVLFFTSLDQTIRRPEQVTSHLGLDVLGSISSFQKSKK